VQGRLEAAGYSVSRSETSLSAWRGISIFPARIFFLFGAFCLFTGILISLVTRTSYRGAFIEKEPFTAPSGKGGVVERITFEYNPGPILAKKLTMEVAPTDGGEARRVFGLYPPSLFGGTFVYPRYLGIALAIRFSAPDMAQDFEKSSVFSIYPPGKEATMVIPNSPYKIVLSLAKPEDDSDPYVTGKMSFLFKVMKGKEVTFSGSAPGGGEFVRDGYRLSFPDSRRMVITDFIGDYGVYLIWVSAIAFLVAGCAWLPVRTFFPRRELLFRSEEGLILACSLAEGKERNHAGVFHEALDVLEMKKHDNQPPDNGIPVK
jgi:hypothetical protein